VLTRLKLTTVLYVCDRILLLFQQFETSAVFLFLVRCDKMWYEQYYLILVRWVSFICYWSATLTDPKRRSTENSTFGPVIFFRRSSEYWNDASGSEFSRLLFRTSHTFAIIFYVKNKCVFHCAISKHRA